MTVSDIFEVVSQLVNYEPSKNQNSTMNSTPSLFRPTMLTDRLTRH
jgi:hypothetical protein